MSDKRHLERIKAVQELYSLHFHEDTSKNLSDKVKIIFSRINDIDTHIKNAAPKFPLEKIAMVDLAILRLATYELVLENKIPPKVIINEAVELAKDLSGDKSPAFVNAVLGTIYNEKMK